MPYVFLGKRHRGMWKPLAGWAEPSCSPWAMLLSRGSWFVEEAVQKIALDWILPSFFWWLIGSFCTMPGSSCPSFSASKYCFSLSSSPNLFLNYCFVLVLLKTGRSLSQWSVFPDSFLFFQLLQRMAECLSTAWFPSCTGQNCEKNLSKIQVFKWGEVQGEVKAFPGRSIHCCSIARGLCGNMVHLALASVKMQILYLHLLLISKKDAAF